MSHDSQQALEFSPAMLIAMGVVAAIGLMGLRNDQRQQTDIVRFSGEPVDFTGLGITVVPNRGWSYLSIADPQRTRRPTLVNESAFLIVRFHPFHFQSWPPAAEELNSRGIQTDVAESNEEEPPLSEAPIAQSDYAHVSIDWIEIERRRSRGSGFLVGRLKQGDVDLMVTVMTHSGESEYDESLRRLCDSIEIIGSVGKQ